MTDPFITLLAEIALWTEVAARVPAWFDGLLVMGQAEPQDLNWFQRILTNPLVLPIGLFLVFYLTFLAPERRRKAEEAKRMAALKKNDRVVTVGGMHGTIVSAPADGNVVTLRIDESNNTRVKLNRNAIASVVEPSADKKEPKDKSSDADSKESA